ncbi:MAG TPA: glycosyl hydrolase family 18 protein [Chthonomonadaceae bacterium]|nr:glycosyl hydrolase family 18 protein [Chthonomonadaceae bacterium]
MPEHTKTKTERRHTRRWGRWIGGVALLALLLGVLDYYAYPYGTPPDGPTRNRGTNGLWLRYTWYFGEHNEIETKQLARDLHERQIRSAYFHVRDVQRDGTLRYHKPETARKCIAILHREAPEVRLFAWVYMGNRRGDGEVDLSNGAVRQAMVKEARWLVEEVGFDGVQWDYEVTEDGDADFLSLLRETRAVLPPGKQLSVATPMWLPNPLRHWGWSDAYFRQVAAYCDQMAVMCYDSAFWTPRSYVWLVQQQALHVPRDAVGSARNCRVLLGLPTYGDGFRSHNPRAENLRFALRGVREGLAMPGVDLAAFDGIALFADYTTNDKDWRTYADLWQK